MRQTTAILTLLPVLCLLSTDTFAQSPQRGNSAAIPADVDPKLWRVLEIWAQRSSQITKLKGQVKRRVYDIVHTTEEVGDGSFVFAAPDKGRLDIHPSKINAQILQMRKQAGPKKVRKQPNGEPYELKSALEESWICDGQQLISINVEEKSADIVPLPEQLQGGNIMNGPLPFLFGLPPSLAVKRFKLTLTSAPTQQKPFAQLKAIPLWREDSQNWQSAQVLLDLKQGLPRAVRLTDPAGTRETTYIFHEVETNPGNAFTEMLGRDPFKPNLRGYNVTRHNENPAAQARVQQPSTMPNLIGLHHTQAKQQLMKLGNPQLKIDLHPGPAAPSQEKINTVQKQMPKPGTPLKDVKKVALLLLTNPNAPQGRGR